MKTIGIIAEYNPFHNGHKYMLQELHRKYPEASIIAVMSGSFTQRGEASCLSKWQRAAAAVKNGVSLVLELPFIFSTRSAQYFAQGGIQLLHRTNVVNYLAFGAEYDNISVLKKIAEAETSAAIQKNLKENLDRGLSYAAALGKAVTSYIPEAAQIIKEPNNILAIEYLKALQLCQSPIQPVLLKRAAAPYHSTFITGSLASASAIRKALYESTDVELLSNVIPKETKADCLAATAKGLPGERLILRSLLTSILINNPDKLGKYYGVNEGLENLILRQAGAGGVHSVDELCQRLKSKRYPYAHLKRVLLYILLQLTAEQVEKFTHAGPLYARILAFDNNGRKLIHEMKKNSSLPVVERPAGILKGKPTAFPGPLQEMLLLDIQATELRNLCLPLIAPVGRDYTQPPIYVSKS